MSTMLRTWRAEAQLDANSAATGVGVSLPTWSRWETGRRRVPAERVLDVERITGISRHDLRPDLYPREPAPSTDHGRA
ncbi:transcriptional regulator [Ancylobacter polymorphus]|uniref:DNA-binding transcriptional regulator YdaS (Cro superfamily) n=1 Tax=Ancylobacter polymorphus TaxID=223390 RepID=A0ABU0BJ67_9HYPH|nr:YdaS family helix-turn-helix protein [Ancylobacter polymorphus]MDQ0305303.1 DNA-binding transcriptional regulator YdaS (Cro superfamily) [Ancylobacter polymorphus]